MRARWMRGRALLRYCGYCYGFLLSRMLQVARRWCGRLRVFLSYPLRFLSREFAAAGPQRRNGGQRWPTLKSWPQKLLTVLWNAEYLLQSSTIMPSAPYSIMKPPGVAM
jgi:hypothetical protein